MGSFDSEARDEENHRRISGMEDLPLKLVLTVLHAAWTGELGDVASVTSDESLF